MDISISILHSSERDCFSREWMERERKSPEIGYCHTSTQRYINRQLTNKVEESKMTKNILFLFIFYFLNITSGIAQPEIISIVPNSGYPGETLNVIITGTSTNFINGVSSADFGPGIEVQSFQVANREIGTALIIINSNAEFGLRKITIATNNEIVSRDDGFEVLEQGTGVTVRLEVVPVEVLFLADFDPTNIANAPLLFIITLVNDNLERDLKLQTQIFSEQYGNVVTATKTLPDVKPNNILTVNNREFDDYDTFGAGDELIDISTKTGMLPPDTYTYAIEVLDEQGNLIAEDEGINTTTNPTSELELISPGAPFDQAPATINNNYPLFQWFSQASSFNYALYEVNPGQTSAEDVVENLPVFQEERLTANSFLYPNYAEILQVGKTYAWQVKAHVTSNQGDQLFPSEVFWFTVGADGAAIVPIASIEVKPTEIELFVGETYRFTADAYNENDEFISFSPEWRVVPADGGTIDAAGFFIAGQKPITVAVVAESGEVVDYATVSIRWKYKMWDMEKFMKELFGLPKKD